MIGDLKSIVDLLRSALSDISKSRSAKEREGIVLDLLRCYFLFKDCTDEGEKLIEEAGPDPIATVRAKDEWTAAATLERWDSILLRQSNRLQALRGFILGQHLLSVINPALQEKIDKVIGSKSSRTSSLHKIGAALFFRSIFPIAKTNDDRASYVSIMAGAEDDLLNMDAARSEIGAMRESLGEYRLVVGRLLSDDEITRLARQARNDTLYEIRK